MQQDNKQDSSLLPKGVKGISLLVSDVTASQVINLIEQEAPKTWGLIDKKETDGIMGLRYQTSPFDLRPLLGGSMEYVDIAIMQNDKSVRVDIVSRYPRYNNLVDNILHFITYGQRELFGFNNFDHQQNVDSIVKLLNKHFQNKITIVK